MAATDLQDALTALDALIKAKFEGATDLSEFYDEKFGQLEVLASKSIDDLFRIREKLQKAIAASETGENAWIETILY